MLYIRAFLACTFAILATFGSQFSRASEVGDVDNIRNRHIQEFIILHTNDVHGYVSGEKQSSTTSVGGLARVASYRNLLLENGELVVLVDAGDAITGTPLSKLTKGRAIYSIMSRAKYDIGLLGNHEFDHGAQNIAALREAADFPILSANIKPRVSDADYVILEILLEF